MPFTAHHLVHRSYTCDRPMPTEPEVRAEPGIALGSLLPQLHTLTPRVRRAGIAREADRIAGGSAESQAPNTVESRAKGEMAYL